MGKTIAYIRISTKKQDLDNQRLEILEYARRKNFHVDGFIEVETSSKKTSKQRRIDELLELLGEADTLIVSELSRLGRSTQEIIDLINCIVNQGVRIIIIKQNFDIKKNIAEHDIHTKIVIHMFSLLAELERDLISMRTKEALYARKSKGVKLGKPKGTVQKSKFDAYYGKIKELRGYGLSVRKIIKVIEFGSLTGLYRYVKKKGI